MAGEAFEAFLRARQGQDLLRFVVCGSVDDGKSTLLGRLLFEAGQVFEDQLAAVVRDSRRYGTQGDAPDLALLVDGLAAEREQGITIDVAYRYFESPRRRFIVADTPGHAQYTRNFATGASTADLAVLLVDASAGLLTQTRRHATIAALVGVGHVVLAVNKLDRVGWDAAAFHAIEAAFRSFAQGLGIVGVQAIPLCALTGDNVTRPSARLPWYDGPTLLAHLEAVPVRLDLAGPFALPVQAVIRPDAAFRGVAGTVARGAVAVGDEVCVVASGQRATVTGLVSLDGPLVGAEAGHAVTMTLAPAIDVSRGDVLTAADAPLATSDRLEATLVWLHEEPGLPGRTYALKLATQTTSAMITALAHRLDVDTGAREPATALVLNDVGEARLTLGQPVAFAPYAASRALGAFVLIDRLTHATVAAGMIRAGSPAGSHVTPQALSVTPSDRERLKGHRGHVVWLTGLPGAGKSTLADALDRALHVRGRHTYVLDGDNVRLGLNVDLGFSEADRVENVRRVGEVARLMADAGLIVIVALVSPFRAERERARERLGEGRFTEVWVDTPQAVCEARDPKGLYRRARAGQLADMTGVASPYEPPACAEVVLSGDWAVAEAVERLLGVLEAPVTPA